MKKYLLTLSGLLLASCDDMVGNGKNEAVVLNKPTEATMPIPEFLIEKNDQPKDHVYQTTLECEDGDRYKISISASGERFTIYLNDEVLLSTSDMTPAEKKATREVALEMVEDMRLIQGAEEFLVQNGSYSRLGAYRSNGQHTLQIPRMKSRIRSSKARLLENITEMMQILIENEAQAPVYLQEGSHLKLQVSSKRARFITNQSFSRQNEG